MLTQKNKMIKNVKDNWKKNYQINPPQLADNDLQQLREPTFIDLYLQQHQHVEDGDVFDRFIKGSPDFLSNNDNVFQWFNNTTSPHLPLRDLAYDVLSIPAMSAEVERVFSQVKRLISNNRNRLIVESIEMLVLLKYWWDRNIVTQRR